MKFAIRYEVVVHDDEGNMVADAQAQLNVANVQALVQTVQKTVLGVISMIDEADKAEAKKAVDEALARASSTEEVN